MNRRSFLQTTLALALPAPEGQVMTVTGPVPPGALGLALPHEHVMSLFGADQIEPANYDAAKLMAAVVPYLKELKQLGCGAVADCTTAWFGRDAALLKRVSEAAGLKILTNTGYYAAANDRYVPPHAYKETAAQLAERWTKEFRDGIAGTGIRPGFVKLGVDPGPLSEIDRKLVRAGALTHLRTGLVVQVHTGDNPASAREQLAILRQEGVSPSAWIWVHAHSVKDEQALLETASAGAWLEFDGLQDSNVGRHAELLLLMKKNSRLAQSLVSHDGNSFPYGGKAPKTYDTLFRSLVPALRKSGFTQPEIQQLTVDNPARAFTIRVRKAA